MRTSFERFRWLGVRLPSPDGRRLVVITGQRQVGKTTLVHRLYGDVRYVSLDAPEDREALRRVPTAAWGRTVGPAVLDEAQKEPAIFDKVKDAYDRGAVDFSVLLGSSRFLLLDRIRETLAGRAFVYELWPLMPSEVAAAAGSRPREPLFTRLLTGGAGIGDVLDDEPAALLGDDDAIRREALDHVAAWGGMPELLRLDDADRREWLRSYETTFLERDLADLVRLADLLPFRTLQRLAMLRSAGLLSYADLARDAGLSPSTARRYLEYLGLTYQVLLLPPFHENLTSAVVKTPKVYWTDLGLLRHGTGQRGDLTGPLFETLVVIEAHKAVSTLSPDARLSFYRTRSGLEVDLLVETPDGLLALECKNRPDAHPRDLTALRRLAEALGPRWRGGLVVTTGRLIDCLDPSLRLWSVPAHRLFGA